MDQQEIDLELIKENAVKIRKKVRDAAEKSGRSLEDITLIAVTKTQSIEKIRHALQAGMLDLGENKVQELCDKYSLVDTECRWHLIGHLQTNKVKFIIDKVHMIHSLDRLDLANEIQKRAAKAGRTMDVLVQVNVAGEESKFGISPEEAGGFVKQLAVYPNLRVRGLMTVAPHVQNPEDVRPVFRQLKKIFIDIRQENIDNINMDYLSMGMSNDYEVAIEEGANMVRIGTAIFGARNYPAK